MTYVLSGHNPRGLRGALDDIRAGTATAQSSIDDAKAVASTAQEASAAVSSALALFGGTAKGTRDDPVGGIGGASEKNLRKLYAAGMTFKSVRVETGLTFEKYICMVSKQDSKHYKFRVPGSGFGFNDQQANDWVNKVSSEERGKRAAALAAAASAAPQRTTFRAPSGFGMKIDPAIGLKRQSPSLDVNSKLPEGDGASGSKTTIVIAGVLAAAAVAFLATRKAPLR